MHSLNLPSFRKVVHSVGDDYDFTTPRLFRQLFVLGLALLVVYLLGALLLAEQITAQIAPITAIGITTVMMLPGILTHVILGNLTDARLRVRENIAHKVNWRGDEQVLDVGVGSGITLFGCAHHLTTGKAIGIDIYDPNSGGGTHEIFWKNAEQEGLIGKVELHNADARDMPFDAEQFDVIVSTFAYHHINGKSQATREIMRVLKPGGTLLVKDMPSALIDLENDLRSAGYRVEKEGQRIPLLIAHKPA